MEAFPADRGAGLPGEVPDLPEALPGEHPQNGTSWRGPRGVAAATPGPSGETHEHLDDVVTTAESLCDLLGVEGGERDDVLAAARLHDIGKVAVPRQILEKRGSLSDADWAEIQRHPVAGERILRAVPEMAAAATLVRHSHERWDGGGYPDGLAGKEIPLGSRIILCADAFHSMRCNRPYRSGIATTRALEEIAECAESQFDPDVVAALCAITAEPSAGATTRPRERRRRFLPRFRRRDSQ